MMELIVGALALILVLLLAWSQLRMKRKVSELERRLAALTSRVYELEHPAPPQEAPLVEEPSPVLPMPPPPIHRRTSDDWEALVGGSWLHRIGALILVVGIALFLVYSLTHAGPAGKVGIGFTLGFAMLAAGIALRSSERYG